MVWTVRIGQADDPAGIITQERITAIRVTEEFGLVEFSFTIKNPTAGERTHVKGRMDSAIVQIKRNTDVLVEGFIEDVESGGDYVTYTGRSFIILMGYSTGSTTATSGHTEAEYSNSDGCDIIEDLIELYCETKDDEIRHSVSLKDIYEENVEYGGDVKLHGKKVYQIVREMCQSYGHDLWSTATWVGNNVTGKIMNVGKRTRGSSISPYKTLEGGIHLKNIPMVKYRSSQTINCLRVIGGGTGKDRVSVFVEDGDSIEAIGYVEGEPYQNNMIRSVDTAQSIGEAIIDAKKDPIEELHVDLAIYISDIEYGDWVNIIDTHSNIDTIKRITKITRTYSLSTADTMSIEVGEKFDNYQNIINDLTKGDVDPEPEMTYAGGSLRMTANDPPSEWVRVAEGTWYGTDGQPYKRDSDGTVAWLDGNGAFPDSSSGWRKAVVQVADVTLTLSAALGDVVGTAELAENSVVSADALNMPVGIVILRQSGDADAISDIHDTKFDGRSYIYLDARPIVGSASSGFGGEGSWELTTTTKWAASTVYAVGDFIGANIGGVDRSYECTTGGTSGVSEPVWTSTLGGINSDNSCVWTCRRVRLTPISRPTLTDMDIWVKPQGDGIVYLG